MADKKLHIALLFGGNSSEHDVSKRSAHTVYDALDKDKYEVSVFMFTKDGFLLGNEDSMKIFNGAVEDEVVAEAIKDVDFSNPLANLQNLSEVKDVDLSTQLSTVTWVKTVCPRLVPFIEQTLYR